MVAGLNNNLCNLLSGIRNLYSVICPLFSVSDIKLQVARHGLRVTGRTNSSWERLSAAKKSRFIAIIA